ncbi:MAG: hypothetical protein HY962_16235 [Ignavibacteriae bacterium]|nr:hypothetical protein [Ignavibacteriota bacterium]
MTSDRGDRRSPDTAAEHAQNTAQNRPVTDPRVRKPRMTSDRGDRRSPDTAAEHKQNTAQNRPVTVSRNGRGPG